MKCARVLPFLLVVVLRLPAQVPSGAPPISPAGLRRGLAELDEVIQAADALKLPDNKILIQCRAADLLWDYDRARALGLFADVVSEFSAFSTEAATNRRAAFEMQERFQLRHQVAMTLAHHEPRLALDFVRATKTLGMSNPEMEEGLELDLAQAVAQQDAQLAAQLAAVPGKAYPYQLPSVWSALAQKDPRAAAVLSGKMLQTLRNGALSSNQEAASFAVNWLNMIPPPVPGAEPSPGSAAQQQVARELASLLTAAALDPVTSRDVMNSLQGAFRTLEAYSPASKNQLEARAAQLRSQLSPGASAWQNFQQVAQNASIGDALAMAEHAPIQMRAGMYQQLAWRAAGNGDLDTARAIADRVPDPAQRQEMLANLNQQLAMHDAEAGDFGGARAVASIVEPPERAVEIMGQIGMAAARKGHRDIALSILEEARRMLPGSPEDQQQLNATLQLGRFFAEVDPVQSAQMMGAAAVRLNDLLPAVQALDAFSYGPRSFREGELILQNGGVWAGLFQEVGEAVSSLGHVDPAAAESVIHKIELPEVRASMRLRLAETMLQQNSARGTFVFRSGGAIGSFCERN